MKSLLKILILLSLSINLAFSDENLYLYSGNYVFSDLDPSFGSVTPLISDAGKNISYIMAIIMNL